MKNKMKTGILLAILAAALYALNAPLSKRLLAYMPPTLMAGFLYLGAGARRTRFGKEGEKGEEKRGIEQEDEGENRRL